MAENSSETLRKVSEIYDRIAFAGVGRYNEFDQLRVAGVRAADLKGYQYSRDDVDARSLANQYAQILGQIFTHEMKPMEVEILVAEVGIGSRRRPDVPHPVRRHGDRPARLRVLGGDAEAISNRLAELVDDSPTARRRRRRQVPPSPAPTGSCPPPTSRWPCSTAATVGAASAASTDDEVTALLSPPAPPATPAPRRDLTHPSECEARPSVAGAVVAHLTLGARPTLGSGGWPTL